MNLGVDLVRMATPTALQPGIGLRPGGERPDLEDFVVASYFALYDSVGAYAARGLNVVVDVGHHDWYSRPRRILQRVAPALAELGAVFVGVKYPIEVLMQRRHATGWSEQPYLEGAEIPVAVGRWSRAVHDPGIYDLEIDTSRMTPKEAATEIRARLGRVRKNDSYLGAQFRRFQRRFGKKAEGKAIFACAHSLIVMIYHVVAEPDVVYEDLGADWFQRHSDTEAHTRRLVRELEKLGHHVSLTPAA